MIYLSCMLLLACSGLTPGVEITSPENSGVYSSPGIDVRAVLDYENLLADSVLFSLNGGAWCPLPRLDTDWYTYMQNDLHHGFSESPAPHDATVLWTAPICSTIHEFPNPVIVDGIVYYPSNMGTDSLYALDPLTGEVIWKYLVGETDDAVTVKDGFLYIASDSLWCLDALTGAKIWASAIADWSGSTPAVDGGRVYAGRNVTGGSNAPGYPVSSHAWTLRQGCQSGRPHSPRGRRAAQLYGTGWSSYRPPMARCTLWTWRTGA